LREITKTPELRERSVVSVSVIPSMQYSCSGLPPMFMKGRTTIEAVEA